jgi:hypothetical protein
MAVKPMKMSRARHMAHMQEIKKAYTILVGETWKPPGVFFFLSKGLAKKCLLKLMFKFKSSVFFRIALHSCPCVSPKSK